MSLYCLTILKDEKMSFKDRLWFTLRDTYISEKILRLFAVWCFRQTLIFLKDQDQRAIEAANVAERFVHGGATKEELFAASDAALLASEVPRSSAYPSCQAYATSAKSAAFSAYSEAEFGSRYAQDYAAQSAFCFSLSKPKDPKCTSNDAEISAFSAQCEKLIEMLLEENK